MDYRTAPPPQPIVYLHSGLCLALHPESGAVLWSYEAVKTLVRMAFATECVYLLDVDCIVHCLHAATGRLVGSVAAGPASAWGAALLSDGTRVFVATTNNVTALGADGRVLWSVETPRHGSSGSLPGLGTPGQIMQPDFKD